MRKYEAIAFDDVGKERYGSTFSYDPVQPNQQSYGQYTLTRSKEGHALWSITDEHGEPIDGLGGQYTGLYAAKDAIDQYEEKKVSLSAHRPKGSVAEQPNKEAPNE